MSSSRPPDRSKPTPVTGEHPSVGSEAAGNETRVREHAMTAEELASRRNSRRKLLLILSLFAVPLLLATLWLHLVRSSGGTLGDTSRGELVAPAVPIEPFSVSRLDDAAAAPFDLDQLRGLWTLVHVGDASCTDACQQNLYHMRQVRLALNHRMDRVQRLYLVNEPGTPDEALLEQHPGLIVAAAGSASGTDLLDQIAGAQTAMEPLENAIYLIDPLGNLMLRFAPDLPPKSMLKDLKHLLKVSRIG